MSEKNTAAPAEQPIGSSVSTSHNPIIPENSMEYLTLVARLFAGEVTFLRLKGYSTANKETAPDKRYQAAKMPIDKEWTSSHFDGHSFEQLAKWVDQADGWIGMRVPDDYIVVDVDNANEGQMIAQLLQQQNVPHHLLKTPNGFQFIFKDAGSVRKQNVKMFTECGFEVDYRLQNKGQIVIPTPNTAGRTWLHIEESDIQEMPYWFTPVKQVSQKSERPFLVPIGEGSRNMTLYQHACRLKKMARDENQILKAVGFVGTHLCIPSVDLSELETIVASAMKHNDDVIDLSKRRTDNVVPFVRQENNGGTEHQKINFGNTDLGNALRLVHYFGADLKYCYQFGSWYIWDGKRWKRDETGEIERKAKATARNIGQEASEEENDERRTALFKHAYQSQSRQKISNMISLAQSEEGVPVTPNQLDGDNWSLNCENGVIDLKTGKLLPHSRQSLMTNLITTSYDPKFECPNWLKFLNRIMQDEHGEVRTELVSFLQKAVGYALTGSTKEQVMFFLYGSGKNGKSTFINVIKDLLADYAKQAGTETFMMKQQQSAANNDIARLKGARFVSSVESEEGKRLAESLIKQLTGGEPVTARFLHQEHFEFTPTFKIFFVTNHKPQIRGTDPAIWRRIRLIPFTVTITADEDDKSLPDKLRDEMPGILRWAVEGCLKWQREGLGVPDEVMSATQEYREEMDTLAHFIDEYCVIAPTARATSRELYAAYSEWCTDNGEYKLSQNKFATKLKERMESNGTAIRDFRTREVRGWEGIGLATASGAGESQGYMKKTMFLPPVARAQVAAGKAQYEEGEL